MTGIQYEKPGEAYQTPPDLRQESVSGKPALEILAASDNNQDQEIVADFDLMY